MPELTDTEAKVFDYIIKYRDENLISPTQREIALGTYHSLGTVHRTVSALLDKGLLRVSPMAHRNLIPTTGMTNT